VIAERTAATITTSLSFFWRIAAFADEVCVDMVVDEERGSRCFITRVPNIPGPNHMPPTSTSSLGFVAVGYCW
jgi:hypothetical protein